MADETLPPYPDIYEELMAGRVIPFLGAGAPLYARNPKETPWRKEGKKEIDYIPTGQNWPTT